MSAIRYALVTPALLTSALPALSGDYWKGGNDMFQFCKSKDRSVIAAYVIGVDDGLTLGKASSSYCLPSDVAIGQLVDVYCSYLERNAPTRHKAAPYLAQLAFAEAWPC